MRIAFVSANRERMPQAVIPLGLLYIMAACPDRHQKALIDLCFEDDPHGFLRTKLEAFGPDLIALGLRNIQSNDYTGIAANLEYYRLLMATIRGQSRAPVVLGGGGFSVMPAELMELLEADYGIAGEGEEAFPKLVAALEEGRADGIEALYRREGGAVRCTPRSGPFLVMDEQAGPDRALLDDRYYAPGADGIDAVQTKRGCTLECDYCTYPAIEGRRVRTRDPERIAAEVKGLEGRPGLKHVFVVDSVFNLPPAHARAVCRAMVEAGCGLPWTCYANPIGFDRELAGLMAQANCAGMEIGSDSGCDAVLERLKKGFDTNAVRRIHELAAGAGLKDCHTFILGTRGETLDDARRTLDFLADLDPFAAILMVWVDDREALDEAYAAERRRLRDGINAILAERVDPRWIVPQLGIHFDADIFSVLRSWGLTGPHWQHVRAS